MVKHFTNSSLSKKKFTSEKKANSIEESIYVVRGNKISRFDFFTKKLKKQELKILTEAITERDAKYTPPYL